MADNLDPVSQDFSADFRKYIEEMQKAILEAERFGRQNVVASADVEALVRATADNTSAMRSLLAQMSGTSQVVSSFRDDAARAAETIRAMAAETGDAADAARRLRDDAATAGMTLEELLRTADGAKRADELLGTSATTAATAHAHMRDNALEAAEAEKKLGRSAEEASAKLDLMTLSGVGSYTSLVPLLGAIGGLVVAASAVAPAVTAAGLGMGAFGLMAIPALHSIMQAYSGLTAAQQAYQNATTAAARNRALAQIHHQWAIMSPEVASVVRQIEAFKTTFTGLAQSSGISKQVFGDVSRVFGLLRELLPVIVPLAQQGAIAFRNMLNSLSVQFRSS